MLPILIAEKVIELLDTPDLLPTERAILKMTASLILYNRLGYPAIEIVEDDRIRLRDHEMFWIPGGIEVFSGLAIPKHWETPEIRERVNKEEEEKAKLAAALAEEGYSEHETRVLLQIRNLLSVGTVFLHPVTHEEMSDEMSILNSYRDHKTLVIKDRFNT